MPDKRAAVKIGRNKTVYRCYFFLFLMNSANLHIAFSCIASLEDMVLSSAKLCKSYFFSHKNKSFTKLLNRIGPSIEPRDPPESMVLKKLDILLIFNFVFDSLINYGETILRKKSRSYVYSLAIRRS